MDKVNLGKFTYPDVIGEWETLKLVLEGKSIARYGDGEFNLVLNGNCVSQRKAPGLRSELGRILRSNDNRLLIGIPALNPQSPKFSNWTKCCRKYGPHLSMKKQYYSAFITRPDSAPWIATDEYFDLIESLWAGQDITMVYGSKRSLNAEFPALQSAKSISVVETDYAHTYYRIDDLQRQILALPNKRVLLMCGPTATCLAARLSAHGRHAIDLGHIGLWWRPHKNPKLIHHLNKGPG